MKTARSTSSIEILEPRIAPASLVNHSTVAYHDADGDFVFVTLSKPLLTDVATANRIFHFDAGPLLANGNPDLFMQQLQLIDLTSIAGVVSGVGISVEVAPHGDGDGFANVGRINATGIDLGKVAIKGDLGSIAAGDNVFTTPGLKSLNVQSIGQFGITTQAVGGTLVSNISGKLGTLAVKSDIVGAFLSVAGDGTPATDDFAKVGNVTIGGSLIGMATDNSGQIRATGSIGPVKIGGDLAGGDGINSGSIQSFGNIVSVTVGGSVLGGIGTSTTAYNTGSIISHLYHIGPIKIYGDLKANSYDTSGSIYASQIIYSLTIKGSLIGGAGRQISGVDENGAPFGSGQEGQVSGGISKLFIGGNLIGGDGDGGASIKTVYAHTGVMIGGSLLGGNGDHTASIHGFGSSITIGGSLHGGAGYRSAEIGGFDSIKVLGNVIGGVGPSSADIDDGNSGNGSVFIGGSLIGGSGIGSGHVSHRGASGTIRGSVVGGSGFASGSINALFSGSFTIGGSVIAGTGTRAGEVSMDSLTVMGSVIGTAEHHAIVTSRGNVTIVGDIRFGELLGPRDGLIGPSDGRLGAVKIGGDFIASSIAVGVQPGPNGYGDGDTWLPGGTPDMLATIASITIGGQALGTIGGTDHYGIVAERILSLSIGGNKIPLTPGAHNDNRALGITGDLTIHEI